MGARHQDEEEDTEDEDKNTKPPKPPKTPKPPKPDETKQPKQPKPPKGKVIAESDLRLRLTTWLAHWGSESLKVLNLG